MENTQELFTRQSVKWSGRQFRNAFLIASSLARYDKYTEEAQSPNNAETVTAPHSFGIRADHFRVVADAAAGFDLYMYETKGKNDGEIAWLERVRADFIGKPHHDAQQPPSVIIPEGPPAGYHAEPYQTHHRHVPPGYPDIPLVAQPHFPQEPGLKTVYDIPRFTPDPYSQEQKHAHPQLMSHSPGRNVPQDTFGNRVHQDMGYAQYGNAPMDQLNVMRSNTPQPHPSYNPYQPPMRNNIQSSGWQGGCSGQ
ncbi:hypothetical protein RU639_008098 [Aspergillus parasiticus]